MEGEELSVVGKAGEAAPAFAAKVEADMALRGEAERILVSGRVPEKVGRDPLRNKAAIRGMTVLLANLFIVLTPAEPQSKNGPTVKDAWLISAMTIRVTFVLHVILSNQIRAFGH